MLELYRDNGRENRNATLEWGIYADGACPDHSPRNCYYF